MRRLLRCAFAGVKNRIMRPALVVSAPCTFPYGFMSRAAGLMNPNFRLTLSGSCLRVLLSGLFFWLVVPANAEATTYSGDYHQSVVEAYQHCLVMDQIDNGANGFRCFQDNFFGHGYFFQEHNCGHGSCYSTGQYISITQHWAPLFPCGPGYHYAAPLDVTTGWNEPGDCFPDQQCPIAPLQPLPDDPCTQSLEAGRGVDVNGACVAGLTPEMQQEAQCLANKITSLGIPYPGPTATVRTPAYQAHLQEIWKKLIELGKLKDPVVKQACASRKAEIESHKLSHGLTDEPAKSSRHETGEAVDVGNDVVRELINRVTTDTSGVQDYINSPFANPPACNLRWGGKFRRRDSIHFQLP